MDVAIDAAVTIGKTSVPLIRAKLPEKDFIKWAEKLPFDSKAAYIKLRKAAGLPLPVKKLKGVGE